MNRDLRTVLSELGASDQQLNSKIFQLTELAVAETSVDGIETVVSVGNKLANKLDRSTDRLKRANDRMAAESEMLNNSIDRAEKTYKNLRERIDEMTVAVDSVTVKDPGIMDAINAYTLILTRTKQVLGDEALTEAVLVQLLETASYGLWRSIMGPKSVNDTRYKN